MAKRQLEEINAGSMADIAFLLLVFFLVATTLATDQGVERSLPKKEDNPEAVIIRQDNIFEIKIDARDRLLVEGKLADIDFLKEELKVFYTNPGNGRNDMPKLRKVSKDYLTNSISQIEAKLAQEPNKDLEGKLQEFNDKLATHELLGDFSELPSNAFVSIQTDKSTSYERFIEVYNAIEAAVNELKSDVSKSKFERQLFELDETLEEDRKKLIALRILFPKRIMTLEMRDTGAAAN
ncbi:MAG: ExbD/TolR family protein [Bacteroidia bacterium]